MELEMTESELKFFEDLNDARYDISRIKSVIYIIGDKESIHS